MAERIVGEIRKSVRERIRVTLERTGDRTACALRIASTNGRGDIVPTQRGLRVPVERLAETIAVLQDAERLARASGLLLDDPPGVARSDGAASPSRPIVHT